MKKKNLCECVEQLTLLREYWYVCIPYGSWASNISVKHVRLTGKEDLSKIVAELYPNIYFNEADANAAKRRVGNAF